MPVIQKSIVISIAILIATEATPKCKTSVDNHVTCSMGNNDYELVRGLVSDNNRTKGITLRSCRIIDIEYESFNDLTTLKYLDLSMNKITRLKLGVLDEPKQLTHLNLSYNMLTALPLGLFDQTTNIEVLDLKENKLNKIELGMFDPLRKLTFLDLSSNSIEAKDINPYIFDQNPRIMFLNLSRNDLTDTPENFLHAFESLEVLNLDRTFLKHVPAFATTSNLKTMKYLIMSTNQISALENAATFVNLDSLEELDLSYNSIDRINSHIFSPLKNLQKIVLRNNKLKTIPDNLFRNIPKLITVHLLGNQISDVPVNAFRGSPLKNLNLSNNRITYLVDNFCLELRNSGGQLKKFLFDPNPWQCACLNDLLKEVKRLGIEYNSGKYNGKNPVCVTAGDFNCKRQKALNDIFIDLYNNKSKQ